jgi:alkylglycerol monooxygenase
MLGPVEKLLAALADLDSSGYYALGVPAYVLLLLGERAVARWRGLPTSGFGRAVGNMSAGLGAIMVGLFLGPLLIGLYFWGFEHLALVRWDEGSWVPWVLAFALGDLGYYLNHRAGHRLGVLWAIHGVHHQCDEFDFTVAMRHPWFSDVYAPVFYAALPLCGVPAGHFFFAISMISFFAFFVHTRSYDFPSLGILVTPASHVVHHALNPRYLGKNLGAMFCVWDKLFGTHAVVDPAEPPVLGTPDGYRSHSGAYVQWAYWRDLWRAARGASTWRDRLRLLVARPGWLPPGVPRPQPEEARPEADLSSGLRAYVGAQFAATVVLAVFVLWLRARHSLPVQVSGVVLVLFSTATLGQLLDGRSHSRAWEGARLVATGALSLWIATLDGYQIPGALLLAASLGGGLWLALARFESGPQVAPA